MLLSHPPDYTDWRQLQLPAVWNDNRLHRFHPLYWSPAVPSNAQKLPHRYIMNQHPHAHCSREFVFNHFIFITLCSNSLCDPTGTTKKSAMVEEPAPEQNGSPKTEQKEENEISWEGLQFFFCPLLATVGDEVLQLSIIKGFKCFTKALRNEHCADLFLLCWKWRGISEVVV